MSLLDLLPPLESKQTNKISLINILIPIVAKQLENDTSIIDKIPKDLHEKLPKYLSNDAQRQLFNKIVIYGRNKIKKEIVFHNDTTTIMIYDYSVVFKVVFNTDEKRTLESAHIYYNYTPFGYKLTTILHSHMFKIEMLIFHNYDITRYNNLENITTMTHIINMDSMFDEEIYNISGYMEAVD